MEDSEEELHRTVLEDPATRTTLVEEALVASEEEPNRTVWGRPVTRTTAEEASVEELHRTVQEASVIRTTVVEAPVVELVVVEPAWVEELDLAPFFLDFRPQTLERSTS